MPEANVGTRRDLFLTAGLLAGASVLGARPRRLLAVDEPRVGPVRLNANENPYGPSESARKAIVESLAEGNRYPGRADELKKLIAERERLTPDHIVLTPGSHAALCVIALAFGAPDGEVVTPDPTYPGLPSYAEDLGARVVRVPLDAGFANDLAEMERRVGGRTKLVYVCNPNNPTGAPVDTARLRSFCEAVGPRAAVVVDEAYRDYAEPPATMVDLVRQDANVVVVHTFSKLYGLAGLRIGYALAKPELAERLKKRRFGPDGVNVSTAALAAAIASLRDTAFQESTRKRNAEGRASTLAAIARLGLVHAPSQTNFVYFRPKGDVEAFGRALEADGIRVVARASIGGCRVTIGTPAEMALFAAALERRAS